MSQKFPCFPNPVNGKGKKSYIVKPCMTNKFNISVLTNILLYVCPRVGSQGAMQKTRRDQKMRGKKEVKRKDKLILQDVQCRCSIFYGFHANRLCFGRKKIRNNYRIIIT